MKRAIDYVHLIGKAIRMERDNLNNPTDPSVRHGMQCVVSGVWDVTTRDGRRAVEITAEYGMGFTIRESEEDDWHFAIFDTEENLTSYGQWGTIPQTFGSSLKMETP